MTLQDLKVVNSYLKSCFLIFPNYNLGHGLMEMAYNEYLNEYYAKIGAGGTGPVGWGHRRMLSPRGQGHRVGGTGGCQAPGPGPELQPHRPV